MQNRAKLALLSLIVGMLVLGLKILAYLHTGSVALKSDALENVVNVLSAGVAFLSLRFAEQPADKEHPYGHGKIEHFSAAFEGGLVALAAVLILYEGVHSWISVQPLQSLNFGLAINAVGGAINGVLGFFLVEKGKSLRSAALEAEGRHVLSDFITTLGVISGLLIAQWTGLKWIDGAIAIGIGLHLVFTGIGIVRRSADALLDTEDGSFLGTLVRALILHRPEEIIEIHEARSLRSGHYLHIDAHFVVPEFLTIGQAHDLVDRYNRVTLSELGIVDSGEFHSHIDPCMRLYCDRCAMKACPIRQKPMVTRTPLTLESITQNGPSELGPRSSEL